jgi:hypothetical protein
MLFEPANSERIQPLALRAEDPYSLWRSASPGGLRRRTFLRDKGRHAVPALVRDIRGATRMPTEIALQGEDDHESRLFVRTLSAGQGLGVAIQRRVARLPYRVPCTVTVVLLLCEHYERIGLTVTFGR